MIKVSHIQYVDLINTRMSFNVWPWLR